MAMGPPLSPDFSQQSKCLRTPLRVNKKLQKVITYPSSVHFLSTLVISSLCILDKFDGSWTAIPKKYSETNICQLFEFNQLYMCYPLLFALIYVSFIYPYDLLI